MSENEADLYKVAWVCVLMAWIAFLSPILAITPTTTTPW